MIVLYVDTFTSEWTSMRAFYVWVHFEKFFGFRLFKEFASLSSSSSSSSSAVT